MRRMTAILALVALSATLTAHAQPEAPVLVTVELTSPSARAYFDGLHPRVYYTTDEWALIELAADQMALARRAGHTVTVIDTRPDPDSYRLVSKRRGPASRADVAGADVLFERDGVVIVRGNPSIDQGKNSNGLKSVPLRPLKIALGRAIVPGSQVIQPSTDSLIASIIARVNPDSVRWFIQQLQNFRTRYAFASTRDSVADWIKGQFARMGYADARRDSFFVDDIWHTNVFATLPGSTASDQIIVFGGHHDSYSGNPFNAAPGADDNASGTAAALETARVLKAAGFVPDVTIKFATFAAEEIGLVGSWIDASRSAAAGTNIKLMINHDMIANNPAPYAGSPVRVYYYTGSEVWRELAKQSTNEFTELAGLTGGQNSGSSDSYSYWAFGYPAVYFFEDVFSPVYHSPADTIGNLNIDYCAEVIRASAATLMRAATMPDEVRELRLADRGDGASLLATWQPGPDGLASAYRVFVGTASGQYSSSFTVADTSAIVGGLTPDMLYYIGIAAVDAQGNQGFIVEDSLVPRELPQTPADVVATPDFSVVRLQWRANAELDLLGYNVYRSDVAGEQGEVMTAALISTTSYVDADVQKHHYYYYTVRALDSLLNESQSGAQVKGRLVSLDLGVMLVDETTDSLGGPGHPSEEQVDEFYASLLADFTTSPYDVAAEGGIGMADMGAYSTVVWFSDDLSDATAPLAAREDVKKYIEYGGKLLFAGFRPTRAFTGNTSSGLAFGPGDFMYDVLGVQSNEGQILSRFSGAAPFGGLYPAVPVDSAKAGTVYGYNLRNIETMVAAPGAVEVYAYDSGYDPGSAFGASKGKPVGIEIATPTHRSVVLSFPLYYIKSDEARALVRYVLEERFSEATGVDDLAASLPVNFALDQNYPNPFNPTTMIRFTIPSSASTPALSGSSSRSGGRDVGHARLVVYDVLGRQVAVLVDEKKDPGSYEVKFEARGLASGIYLYRMTAGSFVESRKMLLMK